MDIIHCGGQGGNVSIGISIAGAGSAAAAAGGGEAVGSAVAAVCGVDADHTPAVDGSLAIAHLNNLHDKEK